MKSFATFLSDFAISFKPKLAAFAKMSTDDKDAKMRNGNKILLIKMTPHCTRRHVDVNMMTR